MESLTPKQRLDRICRILLRGIYLVEKQGRLKDSNSDKGSIGDIPTNYKDSQIDKPSSK